MSRLYSRPNIIGSRLRVPVSSVSGGTGGHRKVNDTRGPNVIGDVDVGGFESQIQKVSDDKTQP